MPDSSVTVDTIAYDTWTVGTEHRQVVAVAPPDGAARTSVAAATVDTALLAASAIRQKFTVYNDSTATLFIGFGTVAVTTTDFTHKIAGGGYYEYEASSAVRGIWDAANGAARITEFTRT